MTVKINKRAQVYNISSHNSDSVGIVVQTGKFIYRLGFSLLSKRTSPGAFAKASNTFAVIFRITIVGEFVEKKSINYRKLEMPSCSTSLCFFSLYVERGIQRVAFSCEVFLLVFRINYNEHDAF